MRMNEVVTAYEETRRAAVATPTWRLKLRIRRLRRQRQRYNTELNQARLIAAQHVLKDRLGPNTPLGQWRPA